MSQRKQIKPRKCWRCSQRIETDARGIRAHYQGCKVVEESKAIIEEPSLAETVKYGSTEGK